MVDNGVTDGSHGQTSCGDVGGERADAPFLRRDGLAQAGVSGGERVSVLRGTATADASADPVLPGTGPGAQGDQGDPRAGGFRKGGGLGRTPRGALEKPGADADVD